MVYNRLCRRSEFEEILKDDPGFCELCEEFSELSLERRDLQKERTSLEDYKKHPLARKAEAAKDRLVKAREEYLSAKEQYAIYEKDILMAEREIESQKKAERNVLTNEIEKLNHKLIHKEKAIANYRSKLYKEVLAQKRKEKNDELRRNIRDVGSSE